MPKAQPCEQGHNNVTRIEGLRVFKSKKDHFFEKSYSEQAAQWNVFYSDTDYATACVTEEDELSLPRIEGTYPTDCQRLFCLQEMFARGYIMTDCRDRRNFIAHNGKAYPVDFGQVYHSSDKFYSAQKNAYENEMKNLILTIKEAEKKFKSSEKFKSLEKNIEKLRLYNKEKLIATDCLTQNKAKLIDSFIDDTLRRIEILISGQADAFSDYMEKHKDTIDVLNENRITGAIWKSICLVLCTGIVPALLGGLFKQ